MDGNGRWARRRALPRQAGHRAGVRAARRIVELCGGRGIAALTLFAFSSENWQRPKREVGALMRLFVEALDREIAELDANDVRVKFIGDREGLGPELRSRMRTAEDRTAKNTGLTLLIAVGYGGRWDITRAARSLAREAASGGLDPESVNEEVLAERLSTAGVPEPDLLIRTGGNHRISNFLLWQLAYTECYFSDTLWPDFDEADFDRALEQYSATERRFGKTSEQLDEDGGAC